MSRHSKLTVIFSLLSLVLLAFQNCGNEVTFQNLDKKPMADTISQGSDDEISDPEVLPEEPEIPPKDPTPDRDVEFVCKTYHEITSSDFVVPPKTADGKCYYVRLMSPVAKHKSGAFGESRTVGVLSADHRSKPYVNYVEPYSLADVSMKVGLSGPWQVALSSSFSDPKQDMKIDNYFLIELSTSAWSYRFGLGTKDSIISSAKPILVNNTPIDSFTDFAAGGTAVVKAIGLNSYISASSKVNVRFRALDCGGEADGTDVFMVFH